jgi:DNA-binding GntR family transcriptional regulator
MQRVCGDKMITPSQRKNDAAHVYAQLKHLVVNYQFRPGTQLHPKELGDQHGVSSTPIREALHRLAGEQLLVSTPNKGFFSKVLSVDEMNELSVLTHALLQHAITWDVKLLNRNGLAALPNWNETSFEQIGNSPEAYASLIEQWIEGLAALSDNKCLMQLIGNLNDRTHYVRALDLEDAIRRQETIHQIQCFVECLRSRNIADAVINLQRQLEQKLSLMPALVKEGLVRSYAACRTMSYQTGHSSTTGDRISAIR